MNKGKFIVGVGVLFLLLFAGILVNRPDIVRPQRTNAPAIITTVSVPASIGMEKQIILQDLGMT